MVTDADKLLKELRTLNRGDRPMFKIKKDPRVTKIDKFVRKTSFDELAQLYNVFVGHMSLVRPRPPLVNTVDEHSTYDKQRLLATPDCVGLWKITERNNGCFHQMVELALEYIEKQYCF